jgi:membrane protein YqaA with SNARE-associated domain
MRGDAIGHTMLRDLYDWTLSLSRTRHALWALAFISFVESSFFPIPPDILMIPMILARPDQAFRIATVCTIASVLGGLAGYGIGAFLFEEAARPILLLYDKMDQFDQMSQRFNEYGAWAVLFAGITPFPYKVITIFSGATQLNITVFMIASLVARGARFFLIAALLWRYGAPMKLFIEKRLGLLATLTLVFLFLGFYAVRYLN